MSGLNYVAAAGNHAPRSEALQRTALERRRAQARRLRPGRRTGRSGRRSIEGISRRTVDYAGLERSLGRPQRRCTHRHFLRRLHLLSNALRPTRLVGIATIGAGRQSAIHDRDQAGSDPRPQAAAAAGDGRQQGDGIRSGEALSIAVRHAGRLEAGDQARENGRRGRQSRRDRARKQRRPRRRRASRGS